MSLIPWWVRWLALALLVAAAAGFGWVKGSAHTKQQWELADSKRERDEAVSRFNAVTKAREKEAAQVRKAAEMDTKHYKEFRNAQRENDDLRLRLAVGDVRVRLPGHSPGLRMPKQSTTASMGDGATGCELDRQTSSALAGITKDGDEAIRKMTALQKHIKEFCWKGLDDGNDQ